MPTALGGDTPTSCEEHHDSTSGPVLPLKKGLRNSWAPWVFPHPYAGKFSTFAFSWFYQIFFSGLLGYSSIPSADITFFFFSCGRQTPSWSMWDPVPWDQTLAPALGARSLGPWTTREAPVDITFLSQHFPCWVLQNPHSRVGWKEPRVKRAPVVRVPKK